MLKANVLHWSLLRAAKHLASQMIDPGRLVTQPSIGREYVMIPTLAIRHVMRILHMPCAVHICSLQSIFVHLRTRYLYCKIYIIVRLNLEAEKTFLI
jgi:hypothetical protein